MTITVKINCPYNNNAHEVGVYDSNGNLRRDLMCADEGCQTTWYWAKREADAIALRLKRRGFDVDQWD